MVVPVFELMSDSLTTKQPFYMRYHLFLQYGWFLQNLGKDFIPTNMHTTVVKLFYDFERQLQSTFNPVDIFQIYHMILLCSKKLRGNTGVNNNELKIYRLDG